MNKILTIVIPSYNVMQTLAKAVDSMIVPDQEALSRLEILIVNDGSTDGTSGLAHSYEEKYPDTVRVIDKENGGHGSVLNVGIAEAKGKYLKFVDGDDWLVTSELEKLLTVLCQTDVDLVGTDLHNYYINTKRDKRIKISTVPYGEVLRFDDIYQAYTFDFLTMTVKTELLRPQTVKIDEHCYYVDTEYVTYSSAAVDTILYLDLAPYVYRLGQATQSVSAQGWLKHYLEYERVIFSQLAFYLDRADDVSLSAEKKAYLRKRAAVSCRGMFLIGMRFNRSDRKWFCEYLRGYDKKLREYSAGMYEEIASHTAVSLVRRSDYSTAVYTILTVAFRLRGWLIERFGS